eukprot:TRINITY_DN8361_c0_g2_i1.p2 TRINITY_DN8361_c0_g2~~TRINITY_DN8361_c0_g2_i1.p2  ORF type:complete len:138 (-),score=18.03 TRINITY_DN8361_c0_g2_i1:1-414(-)
MDCNMPVMDGLTATRTIRTIEHEIQEFKAHSTDAGEPLEGDATPPSSTAPTLTTTAPLPPACEVTARSDITGQQHRRLPIVALTASGTAEYRQKCLESGMDGCLTKPLRRTDFVRVFTGCIGDWRSQPRSPLVLCAI